jgi:hypothetical protein
VESSARGLIGDVVSTLAVSGGVLYVGGRFDEVGGQRRENLAAVDRTAGLATSWQLPANDAVMTLFDDGRGCMLAVCSRRSEEGGDRAWPLDKATGLLTRWSPDANAPVRTIVVSGGRVFVGETSRRSTAYRVGR